MADDDFLINLMKFACAQLHLQTGMQVAREMFDKSYFSLGAGEKASVDQTVLGMVASNYNWVTPALLQSQQSVQPIGFQAPSPAPKIGP